MQTLEDQNNYLSMVLNLGLLIFSFIVTSLLVVPFINLLYKLRFIRRAEAPKKGKVPLFDKIHDKKAGTPVGGGLIVVGVVSVLFAIIFPLISYLGVYIQKAYPLRSEVQIIFFAFLSFALLGLYDDIIKLFGRMEKGRIGLRSGLKRRDKFALQWLIALIISFLLYRDLNISIIHLPLIETTVNLGIFYIPFAAFTIVSFVNAVNITDGLDGLASGVLLICLFAFWILAAKVFDTPLSVFISLWIGALIAFLYFNIWPARIFMGDSGALAFGATLAVVGLLSGKIFSLVIIGGIFVAELLTSLIQLLSKKFLGRPVFPMAPLHLTLQVMGWQEPKIVMRAWLAGIMLAVFGLWLAFI